MRTNLTRNTFLLLLLVLLGMVGAYVGLYLYIDKTRAKADELNEKIAYEERIRSQGTTLKLLAKDIQPRLEILSSFVISAEDDITFIKSLETLAKEQGVNLRIVSAVEPEEGDFKKITFQVVIEGGWAQTVRMVTLIESMPYKIVLQEVTYNLLDDNGGVASGESAAKSHKWRAAVQFSVIKEKKK